MAVAIPLTTSTEMSEEMGPDFMREAGDHDNDGTADSNVVSRSIDRATQEILRTAGKHYSAAGLATDVEIRAWATILACYFYAKKRGNSVADSLMDDVEWIRTQLKDVEQLKSQLTGVSLKADLRPVVTNRTIDRRFSYRTVRVRPDSTGPRSVLRQDRVTHTEEV